MERMFRFLSFSAADGLGLSWASRPDGMGRDEGGGHRVRAWPGGRIPCQQDSPRTPVRSRNSGPCRVPWCPLDVPDYLSLGCVWTGPACEPRGSGKGPTSGVDGEPKAQLINDNCFSKTKNTCRWSHSLSLS